jgi:hypothetical protein
VPRIQEFKTGKNAVDSVSLLAVVEGRTVEKFQQLLQRAKKKKRV